MAIFIDALSTSSLYLKLLANGQLLGTGTGFVVEHDTARYLITNWHVLSGRHSETGNALHASLALPDEVRIAHMHPAVFGTWIMTPERLLDDQGNPLWIEHPRGRTIDVAALKLRAPLDTYRCHPVDYRTLAANNVPTYPGAPVSIVGFPYGLRLAGSLPIWKTGHIATDITVPLRKTLPCFLVDVTTRSGMSGSPVYARTAQPYLGSSNQLVVPPEAATKFLGVYSGRVQHHKKTDAELGYAWLPETITEILQAQQPGRNA